MFLCYLRLLSINCVWIFSICQVSTQDVSTLHSENESDVTDNMLRNHLLSSKVMKSARPAYTSEVFTDE